MELNYPQQTLHDRIPNNDLPLSSSSPCPPPDLEVDVASFTESAARDHNWLLSPAVSGSQGVICSFPSEVSSASASSSSTTFRKLGRGPWFCDHGLTSPWAEADVRSCCLGSEVMNPAGKQFTASSQPAKQQCPSRIRNPTAFCETYNVS